MTPRSVLAVGAYPGDLESGCAGTLAAHRAAGDFVTMLVLACEGPDHPSTKKAEAAAKALDCLLLWGPEAAERRHATDRRRRDRGANDRRTTPGRPPATAAIENVLTGVDADVIYVHAPDDANAERRAAAQATVVAARHSSRVLHYAGESTLRFDPALYVDVSPYLTEKLEVSADPELATATARHFGAQARVRYAEAFAPDRFVWDLIRK
ncbi:PIG-L deacetylase family protein [Actinoplanes sp. N902-109]|uniref:PIG-L deacetylase family protein n=1 Tax=Actinoplanes sp. (strain N902-109) TaxID=649831 RepID=UPI0003293F18|nr:LmbE family protein [Actinoplanes sp. N902-109]AGL19726.1 LmbE family protein [Actinoplanes sp. N902-109]